LLHASLGLVACAALAVTCSVALLARADDLQAGPLAIAALATDRPGPADAVPLEAAEAPPSAAEFADEFFATANAYAVEHGHAARVGRAHCVQASPGHYMCSYESRAPGRAPQCHIVQAQWTPQTASTFTVTLSGRVARCGTLRAALRSLQ